MQVGSIGVITAGFGLHRVLEKYEVERRVYTAGMPCACSILSQVFDVDRSTANRKDLMMLVYRDRVPALRLGA